MEKYVDRSVHVPPGATCWVPLETNMELFIGPYGPASICTAAAELCGHLRTSSAALRQCVCTCVANMSAALVVAARDCFAGQHRFFQHKSPVVANLPTKTAAPHNPCPLHLRA